MIHAAAALQASPQRPCEYRISQRGHGVKYNA
ncbi:Uncharacterised protein [Bordetella pertussis]|nr:Uncharacterised protein [Bordetella pertussis]